MSKYAEEILAAVTELQRHPTAEQVFMEMKKEHPSIAIGTVYKHLNALAEEGLLHRITESGSPDRYDRTERHDHLICSRCGKIADVHLPDMQSRIEHALGRDILSRIIYGSRISLLIGVCAVCVGALVGVTFGLLSGFKGGAWDNVIMRITDVQLAIPFLILALAVIAILGNGLVNVVMVIGLTSWMLYARTVRAEVMSIKNQDFVLMAKAMGVSETKIMLRHILPNVSSSIIVISSLQVARVILFEASLSFLGLGVPPDITTWGSMISDGRNYLNNAWWIATIPGLAIFFTVIGINLVGNRIRDLLDPKLKANE